MNRKPVVWTSETAPRQLCREIGGLFEETKSLRQMALHWADEARAKPPKTEWVIKGMIGLGKLVFDVGSYGCGKTWMALHRGICVARGTPWMGHEVRQGPVLVVDEESGHDRMVRRVRAILAGLEVPEDEFTPEFTPLCWHSLEGLKFGHEDDLMVLETAIAEVRPVLVIVDAFLDVLGASDANAAQNVNPIANKIKMIAERNQVAFNILHHNNRSGGFLGSVATPQVADAMYKLEKKDGEIPTQAKLIITSEKVRDGAAVDMSLSMTFVPDAEDPNELAEFRLELDGQGNSSSSSNDLWNKVKDAILKAIADDQGRMKAGDLIDAVVATGVCKERKANEVLAWLLKNDFVSTEKGNRNCGEDGRASYYELTDKGMNSCGVVVQHMVTSDEELDLTPLTPVRAMPIAASKYLHEDTCT